MADSPTFEKWEPDLAELETWNPDEGSLLGALPVTGDIEQDDAIEASSVLTMLQQVRNAIDTAMNAGYIVPLVFVSREQADAFLRAYPSCTIESDGETYLNGVQLAAHLHIEIPEASLRQHEPKPDARLIAEVGLIPERR